MNEPVSSTAGFTRPRVIVGILIFVLAAQASSAIAWSRLPPSWYWHWYWRLFLRRVHVVSIDPACAAVGDRVTITDKGLGAKNVRITVGNTPARVISASGHKATFLVPAVPPGPTIVTARNPGGHLGSAALRVKGEEICGNDEDEDCDGEVDDNDVCAVEEDVLLPESWAGEWQVTVTYRNVATGNMGAVDQITAVLCAAEPFGLTLFGGLVHCAGMVSDAGFALDCSSQFTDATCAIAGAVQLSAERTGDTLLGSGEWSTAVDGDCGEVVSGGETIEVSGVRLHPAAGTCPASARVAQQFVTHPVLLMLMETE